MVEHVKWFAGNTEKNDIRKENGLLQNQEIAMICAVRMRHRHRRYF
jgi:hypothetical protein